MREYCTQNNGNCESCSLSSYGHDCYNNPVNPLAYYRTKAGLSQSQLAEKSGVSVRVLQNYEQGERDLAKAAAGTVVRLAQAVGVTVEELLN
jgi:DNA-binding transcriptional regulator YiaG